MLLNIVPKQWMFATFTAVSGVVFTLMYSHKEKSFIDKVQDAYGEKKGNWGDLEIFAGGYINFGYWEGIDFESNITLWQRKQSSHNLYQYVIDHLDVSAKNTILELGCGRGVGIIDSFACLDNKQFIGVDITQAQIVKANQYSAFTQMNTSCFSFIESPLEEMSCISNHTIDGIFSVEVMQHVRDFDKLATEIQRVLTPQGRFVFASHLSLDRDKHDKLEKENLLINEIEILESIEVIKKAFEDKGLHIACESIGKHVFEGYDHWVSQVNINASEISHSIHKAYDLGYIDYFMCIIDN